MKTFLTALLLAIPSFAGQGFVSQGSSLYVQNTAILTQDKSQPWRFEMGISNWPASPTNSDDWVDFQAIGVVVEISGSDLSMGTAWDDTGSASAPCSVSLALFSTRWMLIRIQRDPTAKTTTCEAWDINGVRQMSTTRNWTADTGYAFGSVITGQNGTNQKQIDFVRILPSLVPMGSIPPTTYTTEARTIEWKFDNSLADASGNSYTGTVVGGSAVYAASTQNPVASMRSFGAYSSMTNAPLRFGGMTAQLDGTHSYSMADTSNTVTYAWSQTAGTSATFSSTSVSQPTLTGLTFGQRTFQLIVTDANAVTDTDTQNIGAVQVTSAGLLVYPDSRLETIIGKRVPWGYNAWEAFDYYEDAYSVKWAAELAINGGTIANESATVRAGTVTCANGGTSCTGSGTSFLALFCSGVPGPATAGAYIVPWIPRAGSAPRKGYARPVTSCASNTALTTTYTFDLDIPAGSAYGTYGLTNAGTWTGACGGGDPSFYYDQGLSQYAHWYASGLNAPRDAARWIADNWTIGPFQSYGGGFMCPRTMSLQSSWIRAIIDTSSPGAYDLTPLLRELTDYCATSYFASNNQFDVRESGYCLTFTALQSYLDSGAPKTTAQGYLATAYTAQFGNATILQSGGQLWNNQFEGDASRIMTAANGSATMAVSGWGVPNTATNFNLNVGNGDVTSIVVSSNVGTVTTTADHAVVTGDRIAITGSTTTALNHSWPVASTPTTTTFTITTSGVSNGTYNDSGLTVRGTPYCGYPLTEAGTISIASDRVTVTGTVTSFTGTAGKIIFITGLLSGQPWSMVSQIASVTDATHMTLAYPWRGTTGAMTDYRILSVSVQVTGYYNIFFAKTDSGGVLANPLVIDTDNFYWCRVTATGLTLDKPYSGDTSAGNVYRRATTQPLAGRGAQPFMQGLAGEGAALASASLDGVNQPVSDNYKTLYQNIVDWIWGSALDPTTKGLHYGVDFSNCLNLTIYPSYDCDPGPANVDRAYAAETNQIFARKYLSTSSPTDFDRGNSYYTYQMAKTGFATPFAGDGTWSEILDLVGSGFPKFYSQMYGAGKGQMWGGAFVEPLIPTLTSVSPNTGNLGVSVNVTLTGTNFLVEVPTVSVSGVGVTVTNLVIVNRSTATATFVITASLTGLGAHNVTVSNSNGTSDPVTFTVIGASQNGKIYPASVRLPSTIRR